MTRLALPVIVTWRTMRAQATWALRAGATHSPRETSGIQSRRVPVVVISGRLLGAIRAVFLRDELDVLIVTPREVLTHLHLLTRILRSHTRTTRANSEAAITATSRWHRSRRKIHTTPSHAQCVCGRCNSARLDAFVRSGRSGLVRRNFSFLPRRRADVSLPKKKFS